MIKQYPNDVETENHGHCKRYRSRLRAWFAVLLVLLLGGSTCFMVSAASAAERRQMQLSLRQATALALQNNLNIQIAGLTPRIREAQVTEQKGIFDVELRGRLNTTDRQLLDEAATLRTAEVRIRRRVEDR